LNKYKQPYITSAKGICQRI